jgi:hypothetical protein
MSKPYHMAKLFREDGGVSPLCAKRPRKIDLMRATWTFRWDAVTCPRCLALRPPGAVTCWDRSPSHSEHDPPPQQPDQDHDQNQDQQQVDQTAADRDHEGPE